MGILRVYLAVCVIVSHAQAPVLPWQMHNGRQAVQIFYIISGFYMAMVLSSRYTTLRAFYVSRALRIFPPYWVTLLATLIVSIATGLIFKQWLLLDHYIHQPLDHNGSTGLTLVAISNLTLIGQDWIMFLSHNAGDTLHFTTAFGDDTNPLWSYLLVPQAWSIGVELTFYMLAPYLNQLRSRWLVLISLSAFVARCIIIRWMGSAHDPWTYRFFPFEISLFVLGMLGYRLYVQTASLHPSTRFRCVSKRSYTLGTVALLLLFYLQARVFGHISYYIGTETATLLSYPLWALAIPVFFFVFGKQPDDRWIGELSYPVYLVHYVIVAGVVLVWRHFGIEHGVGVGSALISVAVAAVFYGVLIAPLDSKRHSLAKVNA